MLISELRYLGLSLSRQGDLLFLPLPRGHQIGLKVVGERGRPVSLFGANRMPLYRLRKLTYDGLLA